MSAERVYYRHVVTGDRGYIVERDGRKYIRRDLPGHDAATLPFSDREWLIERETRPLTHHQLGAVAFEADKALCRALGLHREARRDWLSLTDEQRIAWIENGPGPRADPQRRDLWVAIRASQEPYTA